MQIRSRHAIWLIQGYLTTRYIEHYLKKHGVIWNKVTVDEAIVMAPKHGEMVGAIITELVFPLEKMGNLCGGDERRREGIAGWLLYKKLQEHCPNAQWLIASDGLFPRDAENIEVVRCVDLLPSTVTSFLTKKLIQIA